MFNQLSAMSPIIYGTKKASPKTRSKCLHNGIILIVNCFVIVTAKVINYIHYANNQCKIFVPLIIKRNLGEENNNHNI